MVQAERLEMMKRFEVKEILVVQNRNVVRRGVREPFQGPT
jgi:hypothetical protein